MDSCKHSMLFPENIGRLSGETLCGAYFDSKRPDNRAWCHFPYCKDENCPIEHPELLNVTICEHGKLITKRAILMEDVYEITEQ